MKVSKINLPPIRLRLALAGALQGVGFRPFVYHLAVELGLDGWVRNSSAGVEIEIEGEPRAVDEFLARLRSEPPPHSSVATLNQRTVPTRASTGFHIEVSASEDSSAAPSEVLPDLATCPECLEEIFAPTDRRYRYPFTNCTHCGPRYSIVQSLPYDRGNTTMRGFEMCNACRSEYENPADRRFHAQPNACPDCGPRIAFGGAQDDDALEAAAAAITRGEIVAIKGIGGYHLLADAREADVIARLRQRKNRPHKPLAVMFPSLQAVREACLVSPAEESLLQSAAAPIVLLTRLEEDKLPAEIAPGNRTLGAILPYSPLHQLLMSRLGSPVVATSGNLGDEPICIDDNEAQDRLGKIADSFLTHDRPIARAVDDSVVRIIAGREMVLRRSRGYAPSPITLKKPVPPVLALGGDLKNTIALSRENRVFLSQHHGDLATAASHDAFSQHLRDFPELCGATPQAVVCDLHPGYHSSAVAEKLSLPVIRIQHHHAHLAACLAEHGVEEDVLGVVWDGTGFGTDRTIWGGEFLVVANGRFERFAHLRSFPLPGGEQAVREPRRSALGLLYEAGIDAESTALADAFTRAELSALTTMLIRDVNSPSTTSAGRLFDAVAALAGLRFESTFEGQAAAELEGQVPELPAAEGYPFTMSDHSPFVIDWKPALQALLEDLSSAVPVTTVAARFHHTMAEIILTVARCASKNVVALSGGCFQNRYLTESVISRLRHSGFVPLWPAQVPPNDGGLALGQTVLAALELMPPTKKTCV